MIFTDYYLLRRQKVTIDELYLDDPRSRYYYRRGWNPKALIAGGVAAVFSLFVAFFEPWEDWSAFSWFVGVVIASLVYYFISARDFRQPELESGPAEQGGPGMTDLDLMIRAPRLVSTGEWPSPPGEHPGRARRSSRSSRWTRTSRRHG